MCLKSEVTLYKLTTRGPEYAYSVSPRIGALRGVIFAKSFRSQWNDTNGFVARCVVAPNPSGPRAPPDECRGTSLIRSSPLLGPYSRTMLRARCVLASKVDGGAPPPRHRLPGTPPPPTLRVYEYIGGWVAVLAHVWEAIETVCPTPYVCPRVINAHSGRHVDL